MDLKAKFNATVELSPKDVQGILEEAVKAQMQGYNVVSVNFNAGIEYDQMGRGAGSPVFKGARITLTPKPTAMAQR